MKELQDSAMQFVQTLVNTIGVEKTAAFLNALTPIVEQNPEKVRKLVSPEMLPLVNNFMESKGLTQAITRGSKIVKLMK
jgi:hypothetical protein